MTGFLVAIVFQAMVVYRYIERLRERKPSMPLQQIGVITPYQKQKLKLRRLLEGKGCLNVKVGSVEEFQVCILLWFNEEGLFFHVLESVSSIVVPVKISSNLLICATMTHKL